MRPKPAGLTRDDAAQFDDASVVAAYGSRPPYADTLLPFIRDLARGGPLVELGCGTGELTRRLATYVRSIVAIDASPRTIARARTLPGGDASNVEWIVSTVEEASLPDACALALAAESFHWFDWSVLCPRLAGANAPLLLVDREEVQAPWSAALQPVIARFSTNRAFEPYDLVDELVGRRCFEVIGRRAFGPEPFEQSIDDYLTSIHSRNGFSRDRMSPGAAGAFDAAVRTLVEPRARNGMLKLGIVTRAAWGRPLAASPTP